MINFDYYTTENNINDNNSKSKLGDHGVRKYDYEIGRFTSVDPLWEKYTGWTGYQYSLNKINRNMDCQYFRKLLKGYYLCMS